MNTYFKSLKITAMTCRITLEKGYQADAELEFKALAVLMGGYNQYGRAVELEKYEQVKKRFDQALCDMKKLLT